MLCVYKSKLSDRMQRMHTGKTCSIGSHTLAKIDFALGMMQCVLRPSSQTACK
jgi:hypothetical protein